MSFCLSLGRQAWRQCHESERHLGSRASRGFDAPNVFRGYRVKRPKNPLHPFELVIHDC